MSPLTCDLLDLSRPFKSRPDIVVPQLEVSFHNESLLNPGFYFVAPFKSFVSTPLIFDNNGDLVWTGSDAYAGTEGQGPHVYDFHTCEFRSSTHLCMLRGFNDQGNTRGQGIILDAHYKPVKHVMGGGVSTSCDLHEFTTAESGTTSLITQYRRRLYDVSQQVEGRGMIWVLEGVFQEIDIESGSVLFQWNSLDHVDPTESQVVPTQGTRSAPWDYFHLNSVEKMPDGNYLISARHTSTILKISSHDGSIIWRLGGTNSSFEPMEPAILFQHHARLLADEGGITRLSVFDNARRPAFEPERPSSGLIIRLDHRTRIAQVEKRFSGPDVEYTAKIAGSTLILPNENVLVGFGDAGCFTEYTTDGVPVFKACIQDTSRATLYRVFKSPWVGEPLNEVALVSYSRTMASPTAFYVSWNGATGVKKWRVFGALDIDGPFSEVTSAARKGFETTIKIEHHYVKAYVEALSAADKVIGKSDVVTTFVPSEAASSRCDDSWCAEPQHCLVPGTVTTSVSHNTLSISGGWQQFSFVQVFLLYLMVTASLILCVRFARSCSGSARRLGRLIF